MADRLRLLVVGTGGMAAHQVAAFAADPRVELVAACDVDPGRVRAFCATHGIARAFADLDEAIAWGGFDAVTNITPDRAHHPVTMKLVGAGKPILSEKPLAETWTLAAEMADAVEAAGLTSMVNLSYRNVAALETARRMIADGEIGAVRHVEASYRQSWLVGHHWGDWRSDPKWLWRLSQAHGSRGVLGDVGIHILDFATHAVGMMPVSVQARLKTFDKAPGGRIGDYTLDANDSAAMTLEFANGALGVVHASRFMPGYGNVLKLQVFGDRGAVEIEHGSEWTTLAACTSEDVHTQAWRKVAAEPVETNYRRFVTAALAGTAVQPDFRHGARLQRVLDASFIADAHVTDLTG